MATYSILRDAAKRPLLRMRVDPHGERREAVRLEPWSAWLSFETRSYGALLRMRNAR
jgi:hypothetical protein